MTVDFNDYFWGEKNNGFDVLYHNMKYGLAAGKELSEFFREKSNIEESNSKLMTKLANKAGSGCIHGTFAPIWVVLKASAERLSSLHLQMVQRISELVKDVAKYADELHKKHKTVKEEEAGTLEIVQSMQTSTTAVQKAKDLYTNRLQEIEKLRRDNSSPKELEKAERKLRKHQSEYKALLEEHHTIKGEFENRMTVTCKRFQDIEETHLKQMKEFLSTYIELLQNNHDMVGQVHSEFKRQFLEMTVDKLLEQFVLSKYTGLEKPEIVELDLTNWSTSSPNQNQSSDSNISGGISAIAPTASPENTGLSPINTAAANSGVTGGSISSAGSSITTPPIKKEPYLRNWFMTSSSHHQQQQQQNINSSVVVLPSTITLASTSQSPLSIRDINLNNTNDNNQQSQYQPESPNFNNQLTGTPTSSTSSAAQSTKISNRLFNGEHNHDKSFKRNNKNQPIIEQQQQQQQLQVQQQQQPPQEQSQQPQKSSRRTTSLLNLFMSNSQGSRESRGSRDSSSIEAISAPTSPNDQTNQTNQINSNIGRNPLRGSKFSAILRSGRNKAKVKKSKKKKDSLDNNNPNGSKDDKNSVLEENDEVSKSDFTPPLSLFTTGNIPITSVSAVTSISTTTATAASSTITSTALTIQPSSISSIIPGSTGGISTTNSMMTRIDEDGYSIQPKEPIWETEASKQAFYSDSDSDSDNDERDRKIHVEIKPLNNGVAPMSASVDELRATVENLSLSPIGGVLSARRGSNSESDMIMKRSQSVSQQIGDKPSNDLLGLNLFQQHQSPGASNASTPTAITHPYAPLQSPTLSVSNTSRYADLGDIFSEIGDLTNQTPSSAGGGGGPTSANLNKILSGRQIPTPTSVTNTSSIAIPRPPSRRSEAAARGRISPSNISRADSVGSLEFRTASMGYGSSRGPSPLTIGMTDTIPLAVAFHEIVHAYFKGSEELKCQVKMAGDMMLSFPAGIVNVLTNNPNPAKLGFRLKNIQNLENILPNKQLVTVDKLQSTSFSTILEFNMSALTTLLRRQSEQNPTASYFNVDILKYQIKPKIGAASCPFQLVAYWKCEQTHTDIKIDYKYNVHAMAAPSPLLNVAISIPVDGGVRNVQAKPHSAWLGESNRLVWNFTDISQHSDNNGVGTLRARLEITNGPSTPSMLSTQFNCEGTTLSGIEFELVGSGYRLSLVKRRFVSGKYICEGDGIRSTITPTPPNSSSPNPYNRST